jgi:predicted transcriptional regulator YdeE
MLELAGFAVIGIAVRTTNAREMTPAGLIPGVWEHFMKERLAGKIPHRANNELIALYTDYESDEKGEYTFLVGASVSPHAVAPAGMSLREVPAQRYRVYTSDCGPVWQVVPDVWKHIWEERPDRAFLADFEVYSEAAVNHPNDAVVDVWTGIK